MTKSREQILAKIMQNTTSTGSNADLEKVFTSLCEQPSPPIQPELKSSIVETFAQEARTKSAEVHRLNTIEELPVWISQKGNQLKQQTPIILAPEFSGTFLELPPFKVVPEVKQENSWGICRGIIGIAETGTIVSNSQVCPSGMLFLVERLVVIINKIDIVAYQEDAWLKLRSDFPGRQPRTINLITGPSRTADVEQHIQLGAHGPRWTDYIIIG